MQPVRARRARSRWDTFLLVAVAIVLIAAVAALAAYVWYPSTLQPNVTLGDLHFEPSACAPVLGGYANRFNATFTLVNTGSADADVWVQFILGNFSLGYEPYFIPQGGRVNGTGEIIWEIFPSPSGCGPLTMPGPPGVALASVTRSPPLDPGLVAQSIAAPVSALGFLGVMLGILGGLARRHGVSILRDVGAVGWGAGVLTAVSAILLSNVVTTVVTTSFNVPLDWTPALVAAAIYVPVAVILFLLACREVLRGATVHSRGGS